MDTTFIIVYIASIAIVLAVFSMIITSPVKNATKKMQAGIKLLTRLTMMQMAKNGTPVDELSNAQWQDDGTFWDTIKYLTRQKIS